MPPRTVSAQVRCHASVAQNQISAFIGVELTICKARPQPQATAVFFGPKPTRIRLREQPTAPSELNVRRGSARALSAAHVQLSSHADVNCLGGFGLGRPWSSLLNSAALEPSHHLAAFSRGAIGRVPRHVSRLLGARTRTTLAAQRARVATHIPWSRVAPVRVCPSSAPPARRALEVRPDELRSRWHRRACSSSRGRHTMVPVCSRPVIAAGGPPRRQPSAADLFGAT